MPSAAIVLVRRSGLALEMEHGERVQARERLGMLINNVMCLCARDPPFFGFRRTFEEATARPKLIEEPR
jgi:hypothetical protein